MCDRCNQTGYITEYEADEHFGSPCRRPVTYLCDCVQDSHCPRCDGDLSYTDGDDEVSTGWMYCPNCEKWWEV